MLDTLLIVALGVALVVLAGYAVRGSKMRCGKSWSSAWPLPLPLDLCCRCGFGGSEAGGRAVEPWEWRKRLRIIRFICLDFF